VKREVKDIHHMKASLSEPRFASKFQLAWENAEATTSRKGRRSMASKSEVKLICLNARSDISFHKS